MKIEGNFCFNLYAAILFVPPNTIYVAGGCQKEIKQMKHSLQRLTVKQNTVESHQMANMIKYRYAFSLIEKDGFLYAIGGKTFSSLYMKEHSSLVKCEKYDIKLNRWQMIADLNVKRSSYGVFKYQGQIYVFSGYSSRRRSQEVERYCEDQNIWVLIAYSPFDGMDGFQFTRVSNDELLIMGGILDSGVYNNKMIFWDLETNTSQSFDLAKYSNVIMPLVCGNRN